MNNRLYQFQTGAVSFALWSGLLAKLICAPAAGMAALAAILRDRRRFWHLHCLLRLEFTALFFLAVGVVFACRFPRTGGRRVLEILRKARLLQFPLHRPSDYQLALLAEMERHARLTQPRRFTIWD